jgi:hypothetical protein
VRILVGGLARSGTTWFSQVIASAPGVQYIHEPDTLTNDPFAYIGTRGLRFEEPLQPGESIPGYELMWDVAFAGGWPDGRVGRVARRVAFHPRIPRPIAIASSTALARVVRRRRPPTAHQVVKSVRMLLTIEWIADRYRPKVVVVWRSPLNVLGSFREQEMTTTAGSVVRRRFETTAAGPPPRDPDGNVFWTICARLGLLLEAAERHPDWLIVRHEEVAADPPAQFRDVFARLELPWSRDVDAFLDASNEPGTGWETKRVASREATRWKERLSRDQIATAGEVLQRFSEVPGIGPVYAECLAEMG